MNKKGWIRMVEVFIAIVLIAGVVSLILGERYSGEEDISAEMYAKQGLIIKKIQLNDSLRNEIIPILIVDLPLSSMDLGFPPETLARINLETPSDIFCYSKICALDDPCIAEELQEEADKNVYARSIPIFATITDYSPKQIKLFCWNK